VVDTIDGKCELLAEFSDMGHRRDDLETGLRVFPVGRYAICYRSITDGIEIVRVLHFSRDIEALFDSP
jgi:toxin ParE1/3/4